MEETTSTLTTWAEYGLHATSSEQVATAVGKLTAPGFGWRIFMFEVLLQLPNLILALVVDGNKS